MNGVVNIELEEVKGGRIKIKIKIFCKKFSLT